MSLEGAFEINDHKAAFHSPLNPPPRCSKRQLCLEALNTFPLAHVPRFPPLLQNATEKKSALGDVWDAEGGKPARRWWVWDKASGGGGRWSLASGRQPYSRQDEKTRWDALGCIDLRQRPAWHPRLRESDAQEWVWEVGLPPAGGRTQKSGMNVKGNIKFMIRKKNQKPNPNPTPNQTNP